jgi:hypothetical protein
LEQQQKTQAHYDEHTECHNDPHIHKREREIVGLWIVIHTYVEEGSTGVVVVVGGGGGTTREEVGAVYCGVGVVDEVG